MNQEQLQSRLAKQKQVIADLRPSLTPVESRLVASVAAVVMRDFYQFHLDLLRDDSVPKPSAVEEIVQRNNQVRTAAAAGLTT